MSNYGPYMNGIDPISAIAEGVGGIFNFGSSWLQSSAAKDVASKQLAAQKAAVKAAQQQQASEAKLAEEQAQLQVNLAAAQGSVAAAQSQRTQTILVLSGIGLVAVGLSALFLYGAVKGKKK